MTNNTIEKNEGPRKTEIVVPGFTLVELLVAVTVVGALIAIAVPRYAIYKDQQNVNRAIADMRVLDNRIHNYKMNNDIFPAAITDVPQGNLNDPWGKPYMYLKIEGASAAAKANMRKDKNLVPINSDFDLYSKGANGLSVPPLTAGDSKDDVVRANNGSYYGLGSKY
ncbi:MAG: type II secretion system GspH family protein [Deltaproteobacteria bacterium]|nr:type II secretion system GspH family protein [Deltaproteobacteria bacterium]